MYLAVKQTVCKRVNEVITLRKRPSCFGAMSPIDSVSHSTPFFCGTLIFDSVSISYAIFTLISLALIFKLNLIINYCQTPFYTPLFRRGNVHSKVLPFSCIQHVANEILTYSRVEKSLVCISVTSTDGSLQSSYTDSAAVRQIAPSH